MLNSYKVYSQCLNNPFVHGFKKSLAMTLVKGLINSEIFLRIHIGLELQREVLQENLFYVLVLHLLAILLMVAVVESFIL